VAGVATFPTGIQRIARYFDAEGQERQRLLLVPGRAVAPDTQVLYTDIEVDVYYRSLGVTDFLAPLIKQVLGSFGDGIAFAIDVDSEGAESADDTRRVFVLFRESGIAGPTTWLGVDLARVPGTNSWVGGLPIAGSGSDYEFIVQAVDVNGNLGVADAKGEQSAVAFRIPVLVVGGNDQRRRATIEAVRGNP